MLTFGIIGCGAIGSRHAGHASHTGKLVAVCDIVEEKACRLGAQFGAAAYRDAAEMFAQHPELNVAAVCTPNGWHARHSVQALAAGCHVICEKPMALTVEDCEDMMRAADDAGRELFVVKQNRLNPPVAYVKRLLDEGKLGRIYSVQMNACWSRGADYYKDSWHGTKEMDGGILFTQFSHFIDLLCWMIGDVREVKASLANYAHKGVIEFEDTVAATVKWDNGALGSLHFTINSYEKNMEGSLIIVAEKGTVKIGGQYLNTLEYIRSASGDSPELIVGGKVNDYGAYQGSMSNHDKIYAHVAEVIAGTAVNGFDGREGLRTVSTIFKIYSAAT